MPFSKNVLAFDFGASSGRAMIGSFDGEKIALEEKHRFSNDPVFLNDTLFWDTPRQIYEIKQGILKCGKNAAIESIGIDTWGVDFGLIDKNGYLLENHVHYRDTRTRGQIGEVAKIVPRSELYARTGIQFEEFNTIYQLYSLVKSRPELIERVQSLLLTPDLFNYFLTGEKRTEYTIASTTQLLDVNARSWDFDLIDRLNIPRGVFTGIIEPGSISGRLSESVCSELDVQSANVISVASHDTASAVVAVPAAGDDFVFLSSGTWSVLGTESDRPILTKASLERDFSNEGGYGRKIIYLKNIIGLWLIQESRRQWEREGVVRSFAQLEDEARQAKPFQAFINPDEDVLVTPGDIPARICRLCAQTGQYVPLTRGEIIRCIYESLALKYRASIENLEETTGKRFSKIHVIGGGAKDKLLNSFTAGACGRDVIAGPVEATVLGNVAVQLIVAGEIASLSQARQVVASSFDMNCCQPENTADWNIAYEGYIKIARTDKTII